jgi:hypothetical protein
MNWTGGRLQRHSKAGNSLKHKQEQHFAKVKKNFLSGRKTTSKQPSLDHIRQLHEVQDDSRSDDFDARRIFSPNENNNPDSEDDSQVSRKKHRQSNIRAHQDPTTQHPQVVPGVTDEDTHSSAPRSRPLKRERHTHSPEDDPGGETPLQEESLSEKRRKILRKGDWVSIGFQRPPQLDYTAPKSQQEIGRRRKVTDGHRAQYSGNKRPRCVSPVSRTHQPLPLPSNIVENETPRRPGRSDVKISIGGRVVPPGISSTSVPSKRVSRSSARPISHRPPSKSSDIMLLDHQGNHSQNISSHSRSITSQQSAMVQENQGPTFSSSSASLRHPIPQSSKVSSLLRSASSNIDESLIAHVGRPRPVVPSSQMIDNEVWETWMESVLPTKDVLDGHGSSYGSSRRTYQSTISPGISAAPMYGITHREDDDNTESVEADDVSWDASQHLGPSEVDEYGDHDTANDNTDDLTTNIASREVTSWSSEVSVANYIIASPLPTLNFKVLSPIAESDQTDFCESPESREFSSVDATYDASERAIRSLQQSHPRQMAEEQSAIHPDKADITADIPKALDIKEKSSPRPYQMDDPGDEIWKKIVFGSDNEEVDINVDGTLGADSGKFTGHSQRYRQAVDSSVLSLIRGHSVEGTNNSVPSSASRRPSVSDLRSQLVHDGSHYFSEAETERMTKPDHRSTAGNADSVDSTSVYFQSSGSAPTQTTEAGATNMAHRGSSIDVEEGNTYARLTRRCALSQPITSQGGTSDSLSVGYLGNSTKY